MTGSTEMDARQLEQLLRQLARISGEEQKPVKRRAARAARKSFLKDLRVIRLPASRKNSLVRVYSRKDVELRVIGKTASAHHFLGWRYGEDRAPSRRRENPLRQRRARSRSLQAPPALSVKFRRDRPRSHFRKAFRQDKIGQGRVFMQRKGRDRYPLEAIKGPSEIGYARENFDVLARQSLEHLLDESLKRILER